MMNKLFTTVLPLGSVAWRSNFLASLCASGAGTLVHLTAVELTGSTAAGVVAVSLFSFARLQWLYSITGEVFALNNLLVAALLYQLVRYCREPCRSRACLLAFSSGLALSNQHTTVLFIVVIAPYVLWAGRATLLTPGNLARLTASALLGLAPYAFMVWSASTNTAKLTWGDQSTIQGFLKHLLRQEYGTFSLAKGGRETASFWLALQVGRSRERAPLFHRPRPPGHYHNVIDK